MHFCVKIHAVSFFVKKVSPERIRIISTLTVSLFIMFLVFTLTGIVMKRALKSAEEEYYESCEQVLEGYTTSINLYIEKYYASMESIYDEDFFMNADSREIQNWIISRKKYMDEDFSSVAYIDENKTGWFDDGSVLDLKDTTSTVNEKYSEGKYFVSNIISSIFSDSPVFLISKQVYDSSRNVKGSLTVSVKVNVLKNITRKIRIGHNSSVYLQDRNGRFLIVPDRDYIGKDFFPSSDEYSKYSSRYISESDFGMVQTESEREQLINLFYRKIEGCGWTLAVGFPVEELDMIYTRQNSTRLLILVISLCSLVVLLFFQRKIQDSFYKNQVVDFAYDPLTKLWTRQRFEKEASRMIRHNPKNIYMLVESDISGFKFINQNYGEDTGDRMIFFYSQRINRITKEKHGIIGRGYADRFYSLLRVGSVRSAMSVFKESIDELNESIRFFDIPFFPKFGITFYRAGKNRSVSIKELIGQVSFAKSSIKDNALKSYAIYNSKMMHRVNEERKMELNMEAALKRGEFIVLYQPKISLADDRIVGAEALVRWKTKEGIITPDKFIPLFERNGFIKKLDFFVYEQVFKFIQSQIKKGGPIVPVSVNMSRNHNKPEKFMHDFLYLFKKYDIPSNMVQVEIIERSFMNTTTLCDITNLLHNEGFTVAMDDFGSGESSLNMLTKIPVDVLKFDRTFLYSSIGESGSFDYKGAKFIKILIDLSKHLEKQTVFEGVETVEQRDFLRSVSCDQVQGYFYSRPLFESDFIAFMEKFR